ncbi:MAG: hypothetical protein LBT47_04305 [Deltaproteobacteria bacterium]|jgi:hypothetical protein|nr:hypothetical protein [Deltaproteobacteria bacterium]
MEPWEMYKETKQIYHDLALNVEYNAQMAHGFFIEVDRELAKYMSGGLDHGELTDEDLGLNEDYYNWLMDNQLYHWVDHIFGKTGLNRRYWEFEDLF